MQDDIHKKNMDAKLIRHEVWNPYRHNLIFTIDEASIPYLQANGCHFEKSPLAFLLKPNHSIILRHQYWRVTVQNVGIVGPFLPMNLGEDIGKGIRWTPGPKDPEFERWQKILKTVNGG